ncbi:MAG: asparaginase [Planctomycetaceae bacterium]|nr:asparaginase [Planctomycetaceae bacterium]
MRIRFLTCGGTIDKVYFDQLSQYQVGPPGVERILQELPVAFEYTVQSVMRKDSLDMTDQDRQLVREAVLACPEQRIVITHGTDTMIETARVLLDIPGRRIVLTGAMQPANFKNTDAVFNVGMALGVLQGQTEDGVWIAMSGQVFDPRKSRKNRERGMFEDTTPPGENSAQGS